MEYFSNFGHYKFTDLSAKVVTFSFVFILHCIHFSFAQKSNDSLFTIANYKFKNGDYAGALNYNLKGLAKAQNEKDFAMEAYAEYKIGKTYYYLKDKRQALAWAFKAKELAEENKVDSTVQKTISFIGTLYHELEIPDSALYFYKESEKIIDGTKNWKELSSLYGVMGELCIRQLNKKEEGKTYIDMCEKYALLSKDQGTLAFAYIKKSIYWSLHNDCKKGQIYAMNACELFTQIKYLEGEMYAMNAVFFALSQCGDKSIYVMYSKMIGMRDSIFKAETVEKIAQYKTLYETEKNEQQNILLAKENNLKTLEIQKSKTQNYILIASICILLVLLYFFYNNTRLKNHLRESRAREKLQKERERISRDLHDNVGSELSYIISGVDSELSKIKENNPQLQNISDAARNTMNHLRETIWALNGENVSFDDFTDKLKKYISTRTEYNSKTQLHLKIQSHPITFTHVEALNLYRITQEALNNAIKYSEASNLYVAIEGNEQNKLSIRIKDDGKGFDLSIHKNESYGLKNMVYRAEEIKADLKINSEIGKGTLIHILI